MSPPTPASLEHDALELQKQILTDCVKALRPSESVFWVFVHIRSIALTKEGRSTKWNVVNKKPNAFEMKWIPKALNLQYLLEPELRTYNELLISESQKARSRRIGVSFGFGNDIDGVDIVFSDEEIKAATQGLNLSKIADSTGNNVDANKRRELAEARLSLGLNERVRSKFSLSAVQLQNPVRALAEEVRYALQILMLWNQTLRWSYIETYHSRKRFDALSGLVVTVCSRNRKLTQQEEHNIIEIIREGEEELDNIVEQKTKLFPRPKDNTAASLPDSLEERLTIHTPRDTNLWEGRDIFQVIEIIRNNLFASTFEGVPESYSFIFGHPGFIARPSGLIVSRFIHLDQVKQNREFCEGALDTLNVVDVLGHPPRKSSNLTPSKLSLVPIDFPVWAKRWEDTEQAFGSSLELLSSVHREMIIIGMMCRNVIMVYKGGELVCVFNGAWQGIRPWSSIAKSLKIPAGLANQPRLKEIYNLLARIAFGPLPRSVIVGFVEDLNAYERFRGEIQPFSGDFGNWPLLDPELSVESLLMKATKTDGAILAYMDENNKLFLQSRARVTSQITATGGATSGTGDATAQGMAKEGSGIVTMKVSRDGGMKIRWDGRGPEKAAILIKRQ